MFVPKVYHVIHVIAFWFLYWNDYLPLNLLALALHISVANEALIAVWVVQGHRPDLNAIPEDAPTALIDIIKVCWVDDPKARPTFKGKKMRRYYRIDHLFISHNAPWLRTNMRDEYARSAQLQNTSQLSLRFSYWPQPRCFMGYAAICVECLLIYLKI